MSEEQQSNQPEKIHDIPAVSGLYENWFLDYASYVILERAVPAIEDGLKPVQRRILHSMKEMDDGRFHKVANIIGQTMQYHPHGDAAIGDALVNLGQKDLMIDCQGNWGDVRTGDSAAAPRYIEARLSKFALEVGFNAQTTRWQLTYDGRKKEPIALPMKFPLLLAQGVEGIAVGLSTKILPHNFQELCKAAIKVLKKQSFELFPDFQTGGYVDVSNYNQGGRGGKVRVRARIEELDKKTLIIKDIPYSTTTDSLIDSILKASEKGKVKIKQVVDNTAKDVEVVVHLHPGVSTDLTIDALYAFTDCELSISPNACVIVDEKPHFLTVTDILKYCAQHTLDLLKWELEIKLLELKEKFLFSSLEKIFIENRIYHDIEECTTWESVIETIDRGLEPFKKQFYREITVDDIVKLTEIKIKRISKFDAFKADEMMRNLEEQMVETEHHLANIVDYTIAWYEKLLERYGKGKERKTEIREFDTINITQVAVANQKLYVNRADGFVGYGIKKDEFVGDCSDIDDIIVFRKDGKLIVSRVEEKKFVGKDILHVAVWRKNDERRAYNLIYVDGSTGTTYAKRFNVVGITRDKEYDLTKGSKGSKILYLTDNANSESEIINVQLSNLAKARKKVFDFDFAEIAIKGRGSQGNILTKQPLRKIQFKEKGRSSIGGVKVWFEENVGRLNKDGRGRFLGAFDSDDRILVVFNDGSYELTNFELTNHYDFSKIHRLERWNPKRPLSVIHYIGESETWACKRFLVETSTTDKRFSFISESAGSKFVFATTVENPLVDLWVKNGRSKEQGKSWDLSEFIDVKGWKANGNKISDKPIVEVVLTNPDPEPDPNAALPVLDENKSFDEGGDDEGGDDAIEIGTTIEFDIKPINPDDLTQGSLF
jgi:topoisomerase-4 subunit A